jgi:ABC-type Fe3+-hydroxamate transport system substrate-binding protein
MRHRAFFFFVMLLCVALIGCKSQMLQHGGTPPPKRYRTAVSLSPSTTEIVAGSLYSTSLVGKTAQCNYPATSDKVAVVMNGVKPNYERIAELRPEIIVYDDHLFSKADIDKFAAMNIETFAMKGDTIEEFEESLFDIGTKFHGESNISEYVDRIHAAMSAAAGAPPAKKFKVAIMIPGKGSEHLIAGTRSFVADVVRKAQAEPVGPDSNQFVSASAESLVALNPDVIVSSGDGTAIQNDPRLQSIEAVKKKRIAFVNADYLLRRGGRVDKLIKELYGYFFTKAREG